ncbi:unnamed protein product (macronuclear) [Paramecium tetraurelia]|uniref:Protein kinase domain-containing protein n=1 Tax=Paramecium tetraurelia TaxID=5888 RepID=A0DDN1_PARTE|nr:uncharacterized protein GSPATT00015989001 [Paramecium tetraurelia]CAK81148.1 unnamed protein product [Paramecium tetraurelia]|eukprot:XP_001448545.1 hypothetical protein (macronuclear) [Paramecium tetraurelia strain d4-2]
MKGWMCPQKIPQIRFRYQKSRNGDEDCLNQIIGISFNLDRENRIISQKLGGGEMQIKELRDFLRSRINQYKFHDQFRVLKKIGKGNFASVYFIERIEDGEQFAVKVFSKQAAYGEENGKESILNEIKIMRELNNEHLMKLNDVFESDNFIYMVLELLSGGSLLDLIGQKKLFQLQEIQQLLGGLLLGLKEMHQKEIMHRDIKLENILFKSQNELPSVVIADFGLATHVNQNKYLYYRCGTPGYVAPEVINNKDGKLKYSSICDIYSLGLVFYILLSGRPAFPAKTYRRMIKLNREAVIDFSIKQFENLPDDAMDLLKKMLEKDPKQRIDVSTCLNHSFISDVAKKMEETEINEDSDNDLGQTDERSDVGRRINQINQQYFVFEASKHVNSPNSSSDDSNENILQSATKRQKEIDSTLFLSGQSPSFKARIESIGSVHSIDIYSPQLSHHQSPVVKQSKFGLNREKSKQTILKRITNN